MLWSTFPAVFTDYCCKYSCFFRELKGWFGEIKEFINRGIQYVVLTLLVVHFSFERFYDHSQAFAIRPVIKAESHFASASIQEVPFPKVQPVIT